MKSVVILTNSINGLYSFRKELVLELIELGFEVIIASPADKKIEFFLEKGCKYIETDINRRGVNPIQDIKLLRKYIKILKNVKPKIVLTYTIKPNIYGGIACQLLNIPYISNITGLGTSIENKGLIQNISLNLYKIGLKKSKCVFFQNEANLTYFEDENITKGKSRLLPGSGVNLEQHKFEEYTYQSNLKFLFIGRVMKAKGVDELLEAAEMIKQNFPEIQFELIGSKEEDYTEILSELEKKGIIKYLGRQEDVHQYIKKCHAVINPSHHEGMSNVLLEAASAGRPVLASDIPGCKETFDNGESGYSFEVKNIESLIDSISKFIELPYEKKKMMGQAGRRKMEKEFDREIVIAAYIEEINKIS